MASTFANFEGVVTHKAVVFFLFPFNIFICPTRMTFFSCQKALDSCWLIAIKSARALLSTSLSSQFSTKKCFQPRFENCCETRIPSFTSLCRVSFSLDFGGKKGKRLYDEMSSDLVGGRYGATSIDFFS